MNIAIFSDLQNYKLVKTKESDIYKTIMEEFLKTGVNCSKFKNGYMDTDPWMNRYKIVNRSDEHFIIVPSNIPCYNNNNAATLEPFALFIIKNHTMIDITDDDIIYFKNQYTYLLSTEATVDNEIEYVEKILIGFSSSQLAEIIIKFFSEQEVEEIIKSIKDDNLDLRQSKWSNYYVVKEIIEMSELIGLAGRTADKKEFSEKDFIILCFEKANIIR